MPMYAVKPTTASTTRKPTRLRPPCLRFIANSPRTPCVLLDRRPDPPRIETPRAEPALAVQPDQEGLSAEVLLRQEMGLGPEPAVLAIITIVAHDEIVAIGHGPLALAGGCGAANPLQHLVVAPGQVLGQQGGAVHLHPAALAGELPDGRVTHSLAVDMEHVALEGDAVARQADHALDPVLVRVVRRLEHHHVATLRLT